MTSMLVLWLLSAEPIAPPSGSARPQGEEIAPKGAQETVSTVPCKTVAECWLDADGKPIARPKSKKGRPVPHGDCGKNLLWLDNKLSCENAVCVAVHVGDKC